MTDHARAVADLARDLVRFQQALACVAIDRRARSVDDPGARFGAAAPTSMRLLRPAGLSA